MQFYRSSEGSPAVSKHKTDAMFPCINIPAFVLARLNNIWATILAKNIV